MKKSIIISIIELIFLITIAFFSYNMLNNLSESISQVEEQIPIAEKQILILESKLNILEQQISNVNNSIRAI
jgi:peptidoglycan hydrolase CwlO-like protein